MQSCVTTFILAGGKGERLFPLTKSRAKPLLPFGGSGRLIDFTLTNCNRSGLPSAEILARNDCISMNFNDPPGWIRSWRELDQGMDGKAWLEALEQPGFRGTADAVRKNLWRVPRGTDEVLVLASDHVYSMDYRPLIDFHRKKGAWLTVGAAEVEWVEAFQFGILETDEQNRIINFAEKPDIAGSRIRNSPVAQVSMGIYVFDFDFLCALLLGQAGNDFGHDLMSACVETGKTFAFNATEYRRGAFYWRDVGTLDAYWKAHMEWIKGLKSRSLSWKVANNGAKKTRRHLGGMRMSQPKGKAYASKSPQIYGTVSDCAVSQGVLVFSTAEVSDSILLEGAVVFPGAHVERAIIDRNAVVRPFEEVGLDLDKDIEEHFVSGCGVVVVTAKRPVLKEKRSEVYAFPRRA